MCHQYPHADIPSHGPCPLCNNSLVETLDEANSISAKLRTHSIRKKVRNVTVPNRTWPDVEGESAAVSPGFCPRIA